MVHLNNQISDDLLMKQIAEGKTSAFNMIFNRYSKRVLDYSLKLLGDKNRADDVAQEVWLKLITAAQTYEPRAQFISWLHTLVYNTAMSELRKSSRQSQRILSLPIETFTNQADSNQNSAEDKLVERSNLSNLRKAIKRLPKSERVVITIWISEDSCHEEIAKQIGKTASSVKSTLFRARRKLEDHLRATA